MCWADLQATTSPQIQPVTVFKYSQMRLSLQVSTCMLLTYLNLECRCPGWAEIMNMQWLVYQYANITL